MRIALLGSLQVNDGRTILGPRDRVILQALAARPGTELSTAALAETLWGENLPETWNKVVQGCVVRLRKALGAEAILTSPHGYRLVMHQDEMDHAHFEHLLKRARELLANGEPERARYLTGQARDLWRGEPLAELADWAPGRVESERLVELRRDAEDLHAEAALRSGRYQDVLDDALRMVAEQPTRERRWGLLALAQYQGGRQGDALETLHRAKLTLVNGLGLDPGPELARLEQAILRQDPSLATQTVLPPTSAECPYLGLVGYDIADAPAFFGRETDITACLRRLDEANVLAIVGPSGCGKSSLARAGVAAALERDGRRVRVFAPGAHPTDALSATNPRATDVLVVDQCEEALLLDPESAERAEFFNQLVVFATRGCGILVISLRADRLGLLSTHPEFARLVERGLYLLGAMTEPDLRLAIEGPAAQAGLRLEPGLVDLLVREVEGEPAALPLLSHVLRQTWKRREGATLTVAGYTATGGIREAVAQSAEGVFRGLDPGQQAMLRDLMLRLVAPDEGGDPVRTRVPQRSVASDDERARLVEQLVRARLLASDGDTVEIAHESLAVAWPRLRSWLDDDVEGLRIMRHLAVAAASWDALDRPDSELYRGARQAKAAEWHARAQNGLTDTERDFLRESAALAEKEERATQAQVRRERRLNQRLRAGLAAVAALLAAAIVAGALAFTARDRADHQSLVADARRLGSEALRTPDLDLAMLLAVAGTRLDDSFDTRNTLAAVLDRVPELIGVAKVRAPIGWALRSDGRTVAMTSWDGGVTIVSTETRKEVARNNDIPLYGVRFNPNGTQLAAAVNASMPSGERRVDPLPLRMFDPQTAALAPTQLGGMPKGRVVHSGLAFSHDGRWLVAGFKHPTELDEETWIRVWDTGDLARPVAAFTVPFLLGDVAVSDDGTRLYAEGDGVHTFDVASGRLVRSAPSTGGIALSPDGSTLAVTRANQVALLDPERLTVKSVIEEDGVVEGSPIFSPKGDQLGYSVENALVVRSHADPDAAAVRLGGPESNRDGIGFSPDGRTLYSRGDDRLLVWDLVGDRRFVRSVPVQAQPDTPEIFFAMVSPDGQTVGNLVTDGQESWGVQLLDVKSGTRTPRAALRASNAYFVDIVWRPDGAFVASAQNDQWVDLWDGVTGQPARRHPVPDRYGIVDSVRFSGDSTRLVVGTHQGWVYAVDASTLEVLGKPVQVKAGVPIYGLAANSDGARALVWIDRELQLLDLMQGRVLTTADPGLDAESWAWTPDGKAVVVLGNNSSQDGHGTVAFLEPGDLSTKSKTSGPHIPGGSWIQFSPDGGRFATFGSDRVGLWDVMTARFLGSVGVKDGSMAGFAQGTSEVLVASLNGEVSVWDPRPEAAVEAACRVAGRELTETEWRTYLDREPQQVCTS